MINKKEQQVRKHMLSALRTVILEGKCSKSIDLATNLVELGEDFVVQYQKGSRDVFHVTTKKYTEFNADIQPNSTELLVNTVIPGTYKVEQTTNNTYKFYINFSNLVKPYFVRQEVLESGRRWFKKVPNQVPQTIKGVLEFSNDFRQLIRVDIKSGDDRCELLEDKARNLWGRLTRSESTKEKFIAFSYWMQTLEVEDQELRQRLEQGLPL